MPIKPLSHSQRLGRTTSDQTYDRTVRQADPALAQAKAIRSSGRWRQVRALALRRNALCADPYGWHAASGRVELATQVDHIRDLAEAPALAYTLDNLQALCQACHARKTAQERQSRAAGR